MLYFSADDGRTGVELWRSDGTAAGTGLAADINPGGQGSYPGNFTLSDVYLYFVAYGAGEADIWRSDGSTVEKIAENDPTEGFRSPFQLTSAGDDIFFLLGAAI